MAKKPSGIGKMIPIHQISQAEKVYFIAQKLALCMVRGEQSLANS
jgi:hypothetical protein